MKKHRSLTASGLILMAFAGANASDYDIIIEKILAGNPGYKVAVAEADAEFSASRAGNALDDPEVEFEFLAGKNVKNKYNFTVSQGFDWPGVYASRSKVLNLEKERLRLAGDAALSETALRADRLLVDITASNLAVSLLEKAVGSGERLLATYEENYKNGDVSILDLNKLRIEVADSRLRLAEALETRNVNIAELTMLSPDDAQWIADNALQLSQFPIVEFAALDTYKEQMLANNPKLKLAATETLLSEANKTVSRRNTLPGFNLGYRFSQEDGEIFNGFVVGVNLPLWRAARERQAADAGHLAAMLRQETAAVEAVKGLETQYKLALNLNSAISKYSSALLVCDNMAVLERAFDAGAIDLAQYIQDSNYFIDAQLQFVELQRRYFNSIAYLRQYTR